MSDHLVLTAKPLEYWRLTSKWRYHLPSVA